jgi:hypothetical protein
MEDCTLRLLIRSKLAAGRLPQDSIPRMWGGPGNGECCDVCEETITRAQFVMEGVSNAEGGRGVQLHVRCFQVWDAERQVPGHEASGPRRSDLAKLARPMQPGGPNGPRPSPLRHSRQAR